MEQSSDQFFLYVWMINLPISIDIILTCSGFDGEFSHLLDMSMTNI